MLITLAFVILSSAFIVFFAQEIYLFFKKIFSLPGVAFFVPLILASWLVVHYKYWISWFLVWSNYSLHEVINQFTRYFPFAAWSIYVAEILILFLLICLPMWISHALVKSKRRYKPWPYAHVLGVSMWVVAAVLLLVYQPLR